MFSKFVKFEEMMLLEYLLHLLDNSTFLIDIESRRLTSQVQPLVLSSTHHEWSLPKMLNIPVGVLFFHTVWMAELSKASPHE